uniref:Uncharacterized protein n=1 Tax=Plectus sambesii TaxID=2011161 RepID=A0A914UXH5_9BILA
MADRWSDRGTARRHRRVGLVAGRRKNKPSVLEKARAAYSIWRRFPFFLLPPSDSAILPHLRSAPDSVVNEARRNMMKLQLFRRSE